MLSGPGDSSAIIFHGPLCMFVCVCVCTELRVFHSDRRSVLPQVFIDQQLISTFRAEMKFIFIRNNRTLHASTPHTIRFYGLVGHSGLGQSGVITQLSVRNKK